MPKDDIETLFAALGKQMPKGGRESNSVLSLLIEATLKFRDELKSESDITLTVGDTQAALKALEFHLNGQAPLKGLTPRQQELAKILIDTVILYKLK